MMLSGGGCVAEHVAEAVYLAAFEINAGEERRLDAFLAFAQQAVRLTGGSDVAGKQDHAGRLDFCEQGSEARGHLGRVEADDEELADLAEITFWSLHCLS